MKENTVLSDFILFNDILDEIATKEKEEEIFFDSETIYNPSQATIQENLEMDTGIIKDSESVYDPSHVMVHEYEEIGNSIVKDHVPFYDYNDEIIYENKEIDSVLVKNEVDKKSIIHSDKSTPVHSNHNIDPFTPTKEPLENMSHNKYYSENSHKQDTFSVSAHSREGSFSNEYDFKDLHDISDSDFNSDHFFPRLSRNSLVSSEKDDHKNNENNILFREDCDEHNSEMEEHNSETEEGKKIQFMLRYSNFCAFLEEVKKKVIDQPEEKFEIEIKNKIDYKIEENSIKIDLEKNTGKKKTKINMKDSSLKKPYVTLKLNGFYKNNFFKDENFIIEKKLQSKINLKMNGLNKDRKLDTQLKATDNPAILSWLYEKERNEKELKRNEFLQRRLQRKEQRQNKLKQEKLSQISTEKVHNWIEQKKKDDIKKLKHLHPAFEEERLKLIRIEKQLNKQQIEEQNEKRLRFSAAKHKSNSFQTNSTTNYTYLLNRPANPVVYISVEAFTRAVINEAINELDMSLRVKCARLGRSKTGLFDPKISERTPRAPTVLKSLTKFESSNHAITRPAWRITTPGFSRTFEEWLLAKKGLDRIKARERITKHYYDELEKEIIKKEKEKLESERLSSRKRVQSAFSPYILSTQSSTEYMYLAL